MADLEMSETQLFDPDLIQTAPEAPRGPNPLAMLVKIWVQPGRALRAVAEGPGWLWLIPLFLAVVLTTARVVAGEPMRVEAQQARMAAAVETYMVDPSFSASALETSPMPAPPKIMTLGLPLLGTLATILLGWLVRAGVLHLGSMALGGRQSFGAVYRVSVWASLPLILREAVQAVYMLLTREAIDGPGLSGLASPPVAAGGSMAIANGPMLATGPSLAVILLERVDLYTIWYVALLVVAIMAAGKLSRGKAMGVVSIYALLSLALGLTKLLTAGLAGGF